MKYTPPPGSVDPNAPYVTGNPVTRVKGSPVPAEAVENPQREIVKVIQEAGLEPSNADLTQLYEAIKILFDKWNALFLAMHPICGLHLRLEPDLPDGFEVWDGGVIENGAELYPEAWEYLQSTPGQKRCVSLSEREELANHVYYTLADGTPITYGGIGGVPFYTIDTATGKIVMPDIRGQHLEVAGFDSLNVGGVDIDRVRLLWGSSSGILTVGSSAGVSGAFKWNRPVYNQISTWAAGTAPADLGFSSDLIVPTGPATAPRRFGILACAFMGMPAL